MTSNPLFISVAESTEILRPMLHFGWAQACSGVTSSSSRRSVRRNGPPDAVSHNFLTPARGRLPAKSRGKAWKIALCSLSIGSSIAPLAVTASISKPPAMTSASQAGEQQLLAGLSGRERRAQAGGSDDRSHHRIHFRSGGDLFERL